MSKKLKTEQNKAFSKIPKVPKPIKKSQGRGEQLEEKLTVKEKLFCKHYLINGFNATQATLAAGYSGKSAKIIGHQLLRKPRIKKYITYRLRQVEKKLDIKFEQKIKLLWKTAKRCYGLTDDELERLKNGEDIKAIFGFDPEGLIKAVAEMNKMQGHYAQPKEPDNNENDTEKLEEEIKKHEREF